MKAAQLRQAILQAAVQGKLVPQSSQDEPASALLDRIQVEKTQLVKEGKIKKEKLLPPIAGADVPYDLPEGWEWCRLSHIALEIATGPFGSMLHKSDYVQNGIPVINPANIKNGIIVPSSSMMINERTRDRLSNYLLHTNDIVIARRGDLGRCAIVSEKEDGWLCGTGSFIVKVSKNIYLPYFTLFFRSSVCVQQLMGESVGATMNNLNHNIINNLKTPVPPFSQQQQIVLKVAEMMRRCDELEAAEKELDALESNLAEYLPRSILQAAVQGKLVPQNIHDEPASELLKRIQAEKAQLVKEGKIKKEKLLPPITEDEIPYDLPDGWEWCRFGELITLLSGRDLETKQFNEQRQGIPYITGASCIDGEHVLVNRWTREPVVVSSTGDLLISCKGTIGKIAFNHVGDCHIARQIMAIRFFTDSINKDFIKIFLQSYVENLVIQAKSMIPGISREDILLAPIPLPPLAEQQRIVFKAEELLSLCVQLRNIEMNALQRPIQASNILQYSDLLEQEEQYAMAARGDVSSAETDEHRQAIDDLFGDGADG